MDIANLAASNDPFASVVAGDEDEGIATKKEDIVHIRVQQRNGRKCITTVQGLDPALDLKKILKVVKKNYCCNGTVVEDGEMGQVLQFQGDQRDNMVAFLTENELVQNKANIKKHGHG
jgi:translation initiation factor 1